MGDTTMDVSVPTTADLGPESAARIVAMCRTRRERLLAEEEVRAQTMRLAEDNANFMRQIITGLQDEESTMRQQLVKTEERAAVTISRQMEDSARAFEQQLEALRQRRNVERAVLLKKKRLQQELDHEKFRAFWRNRNANNPLHDDADLDDRDRMWNRVMPLVRKAYEFTSPPFATDPEELWCRGVVVPPDLQSASARGNPAMVSDDVTDMLQRDLKLPAYHDLGMEMRSRYADFVRSHGSPYERPPQGAASTPRQARPVGSPAHSGPTTPAPEASPARSLFDRSGAHRDSGSVARVHSSPFATFVRNGPYH